MAIGLNSGEKLAMGSVVCMVGAIIAVGFGLVFALEVALHPMHYAGAAPTAEEAEVIQSRHKRNLLLLGGGCVLGAVIVAIGAAARRRSPRRLAADHAQAI